MGRSWDDGGVWVKYGLVVVPNTSVHVHIIIDFPFYMLFCFGIDDMLFSLFSH